MMPRRQAVPRVLRPTETPSSGRSGRTVEESLLRATLAIVAREGSRGATTRRIAEAAGVNEVTLFRHFESKEALIVAALEWCTDARPVGPLPEAPVDPETELWAWLRRQQRLLRRHRRLIRTCLGEFDAFPAHALLASRWFSSGVETLRRYLTALRRQGMACGRWDPQGVALLAMSAVVCDTLGRDIMPKTYDLPAHRALWQYLDLVFQAIGVRGDRAWPGSPATTRAAAAAAASPVAR
jgi:AcrR family transcriptional regulator